MVCNRIVFLMFLFFSFVLIGSVAAVEPTTFPTKNRTAPVKPKNETGVLVEPTILRKPAPQTKTDPAQEGGVPGKAPVPRKAPSKVHKK